MIKRFIGFFCLMAAMGFGATPALTDYLIVLKNGRRMAVQNYREQGSTVYIAGLGGEIGIPKEQIQAISQSGQEDRPDLSISELDRASRQSGSAQRIDSETSGPAGTSDRSVLREPGEQQKQLDEINKKLDAAQARYLSASQGGGAGTSATKDGYRGWTADLMSRLKARRGAADSEYEAQERELRDLRLEIDKLQRERDELLTRMRDNAR